MRRTVFLSVVVCLFVSTLFGQGYKKPPKEIQEILDAPGFPTASISPTKDKMALLERVSYPTIEDMAAPMLRLAGLRINPDSNSRSTTRYFVGGEIMDIRSGKKVKLNVPAGARLISVQWSYDGSKIAAANLTKGGVDLWIIDPNTGNGKKLDGLKVNTAYGGFYWLPGGNSLMVHTVPSSRGAAPKGNAVPESPSIQETSGRAAAIRTYQDLLKSPADEAMFEYYATSQLAIVGVDGSMKKVGTPAIYGSANVSPDGTHFLVSRVKKPYSYLFPVSRFGRDYEVWDRDGKLVKKVASTPLQDNLPVGGVIKEPRNINWIPTEDTTLMWTVALDGGNPRQKALHRDKIVMSKAPFDQTVDVAKVPHRNFGRMFMETGKKMWFFDYDRRKQMRGFYQVNYANPGKVEKMMELNIRDRYNDPGNPVMKTLPNGKQVIWQDRNGNMMLRGRGSTPLGDFPFLRYRDTKTNDDVNLYRSPRDKYETVVGVLKTGGVTTFVTRRESKTEPPNYWLKHACKPQVRCKVPPAKQLTFAKDPTPQLRNIKTELVEVQTR